jgi:hypothetical protein
MPSFQGGSMLPEQVAVSAAARVWAVLVAGLMLAACDNRASAPPHRLVGVWTPVVDPAVVPPTTPEEWQEFLAGEDPTYCQLIFLSDGTLVFGGLMMGHEIAEESRWEILDETPERIQLRTTEANGKVDEMMVTVEGPNRMRTGPNPPIMQLFRAPEIGPFPWLAKYEDRL